MRIDGNAAIAVMLIGVVATATALALLWDRIGRWVRSGLGVACVLAVTATALLQLNRLTEAYPTWSALVGGKAAAADSGSEADAPVAPGDKGPQVTHGAGGSTVAAVTVAGKASGITMPLYVYLPPGYAKDVHARYPVIEATHGFPGSPRTWLRRLDVQSWLDREITAGRMAPTVVLFPYQTPKSLVDTECTDLARGPKSETYLTVDVPDYVQTHYRVRTDRAAWGLIGYSAGGYCSINLALRHSGEFAAGASLSGYATPGIDVGDGSQVTTNNDVWRLTHLPQPPVSLYLAWANDDTATRRASLTVDRLAKAPLSVTTAVVARGGHSDAAWQEMEAPAFDWLSAHLARPLF